MSGSGKPEIMIIEDKDNLARMRDKWEELTAHNNCSHPNTQFDYYCKVVENMDDVISPYIIVALEKNILVGMIIGRIDAYGYTMNLGYKPIYKIKMRCLWILYEGIILRRGNEEVLPLLFQQIKKALDRKHAEIVIFQMVKESLTISTKSIIRYFKLCRTSKPVKHWVMDFPESFELFIKTRTDRFKRNIRHITNKINRTFADTLSVVSPSKINFATIMNDIEEIAEKTFQRGIDSGFKNNNLNRSLMEQYEQTGQLIMHVLYINKEPAAYLGGFFFKDTLYLSYIGYDSKYENYSLGTYMFISLIKETFEKRLFTKMDFGFGDAEYKKNYGTQNWDEKAIIVFSRSLFGIVLYTVSSLLDHANFVGEYVLVKMKLRTLIKKIWRKNIIKNVIHEA